MSVDFIVKYIHLYAFRTSTQSADTLFPSIPSQVCYDFPLVF